MKKTICLASIVILIITAFPILTVSASVAPDAAPPESLWTCAETNPGACPPDANPLVVSGSAPVGYADLWGKMLCEDPDCDTNVEVYVSISFSMEWSSKHNRTVNGIVVATGRGSGGETGRGEVACGTGTSGECGGSFYFAIQAGVFTSLPTSHVFAFVRADGLGVGDPVALTSYEISISGEPKNCDSEYKIEECELGEIIDPTKELAAALPTYELEPGQTYRMKLSGAWQAEEAGPDLTAVEASFDGGATWMTLVGMMENDMVECVTQDPESPDIIVYFTAPSATMKIRVKDDPGEYADNTGGMTMDLCVATLDSEQENCAGQFTVGTTIITTGTFSALIERPAPITVNGTTQWATPGEWYVLTTSGGPWHDGSDPASRYDIQMTTGGEVGGEWQTPEDFSLSN